MCPIPAAVVYEDQCAALDHGDGTLIRPCKTIETTEGPDGDRTDPNGDLVAGLRSSGVKRVPVRFLYDDRGSELYEAITTLEEYYPYEEEKRLLRQHAADIVHNVPPGSVVVELGCGDGSKTAILLQTLTMRDTAANVRFIGIDVSAGALVQARKNLESYCPDIPSDNMEFLAMEYQPGLEEARKRYPDATFCILWLGSSVGNFTTPEAAAFLSDMRRAAGDQVMFLLCTDLWKDPRVLKAAYDDRLGVTREFIINGMVHALRTLGHSAAKEGQAGWTYEAVVNEELHQVEMYVKAKAFVGQLLPDVDIGAGERILMEISRKFTLPDVASLAQAAGFALQATWASKKYSIQLLLPPVQAFKRSWFDTDGLFACISDWTQQPIGLRHQYAFYYGHTAAFARLKIFCDHGGAPPSSMDIMFSRGIDPNVLEPSLCHDHPAVPDIWPSEAELKAYVAEVRSEVVAATSADAAHKIDMHAVMMALEHERMHQETLCYMLAAQRKRDWEESVVSGRKDRPENGHACGHNAGTSSLAYDRANGREEPSASYSEKFYFGRCTYTTTRRSLQSSSSVTGVPGGNVRLGVDPDLPHGYVWDNELGKLGPVKVKNLRVSKRPVTVAEFREFVVDDRGYERPELWAPKDHAHFRSCGQRAPATWSMDEQTNDVSCIHVPEGSFHWSEVADCPVYCSLAEAQAYCKSRGGRIMTEPEFLHVSHVSGEEDVEDLEKGGWEWTSSCFDSFEGFKVDPLYPEYSVDFFDGFHYVLRGSSPYTHPSLKRRSFRNFYQRQYPWVMAKFRLVYDDDEKA